MGAKHEQPLDCVVFIALKEEADIFRQVKGLSFGPAKTHDGVTISPFAFRDLHSSQRRGHLVVFGEMGPAAALSKSERVLARYTYEYAFSIGLSGRVSSDVRLGDVVFASEEILDYGQRMKAKDGENSAGFETEPGQHTSQLNPAISELARNLQDLQPVIYGQWTAQAKHEFTRMIVEPLGIERMVAIAKLAGAPGGLTPSRIVAGPIASGPFVGKAEGFRDLIAQKHNSVLAIDMESGSVAQACSRMHGPKLIALRGVSDPVSKKTELDKLTEGRLRTYSMHMASGLAAMLMPKLPFSRAQSRPGLKPSRPRLTKGEIAEVDRNTSERIFESIERYHVKASPFNLASRLDVTNSLDELFAENLHRRSGERATQPLSTLANMLNENGPDRVFWISGAPGTGRSTFAQLLWYNLKAAVDSHAPFPVYINLATWELEAVRRLGEPIKEVLNGLIGQDVATIFSLIPPHRKLALIIDGFEQKNVFRRQMLRRYIRNVCKGRPKDVVLVLDRRLIENSSETEHILILEQCHLGVPAGDFIIHPVPVDAPEAFALVKTVISALTHESRGSATPGSLIAWAKELDLRSLDLFMIGVLVSQSHRAERDRPKSSSMLLLEWFKTHVRQIVEVVVGLEDEDAYPNLVPNLVRLGSDLAFDLHTRSDLFEILDPEKLDPQGRVDQTGLREYLSRSDLPTNADLQACAIAVYSLVRSHRMLSSVLLAQHGLRFLETEANKELGRRTWEKLNFVYTTAINRSFKHLMLSTPSKEASVLKWSIAILRDDTAPPLARAHVAYLLGRVATQASKDSAKSELRTTLQDLETRNQIGAEASNRKHDSASAPHNPIESRQKLLFRRSVMISLAMLGEEDVALSYIRRILEDHDEDRINRGFHLEYYGDLPYTPEVGLAHDDDLSSEGRLTLAELDKRIQRGLADALANRRGVQANTQIEIATYGAIVQHRQIEQKLASDLLEGAKRLLDKIIAQAGSATPLLRTYICMLRRNLEVSAFSEAHLLKMFMRLKKEERAGWKKRRDKFSKEVRVESVADHTTLACLIAFFYLPQISPIEAEPYDKNEILLTILIHDLCETFTGDHVPTDIYNPELEKFWSIYISRLATYERIHGVGKFYDLFDSFFNQSTLEARIARDIDRLENLAQLYDYRPHLEERAFEAFEADLIGKISTDAGRYILRGLRGLRDGCGDDGDFLRLERFQ